MDTFAPVARRVYIDWLRGLAVAIMIEAHTIDAWTVRAVRDQPTFHLLQFIAGWAAPLFLFLAGVSVALSARAKQRKTTDVRAIRWALQKRGWQIFGLAFLFRFQSFLLSPGTGWHGLLKPDILNVMGLAMVVSGFCWSRGSSRVARAGWYLVPAALVVSCASLAHGWAWPAALPPRLEAYVRINGFGTFSVFPWMAFVLLGAWLGEIISAGRPATDERRFHLRLGLGGVALAMAAYAGSFLPAPWSGSNFWTTSISWFLLRTGAMLLMLALAWVWMARPTASRWSPMLVFGRTSLFVYWIHVEMVYGFPTYPLHNELSIPAVLAAYAVFTAMILACAVLWSRRKKGPWIPAYLTPTGYVLSPSVNQAL
jgi:uncharacterized membrane protein